MLLGGKGTFQANGIKKDAASLRRAEDKPFCPTDTKFISAFLSQSDHSKRRELIGKELDWAI